MMKNRIAWLDIAKGIAILSMIVGHIVSWNPIGKIIFSFHMPLFFIVAGYTAKKEFSMKSFWKMVSRILVPYLSFCLIYGIINILSGQSNIQTELLRILWGSGVSGEYGPGVPVFGNGTIPTIGVLWFLPTLFFSKLFFTAFLKVSDSWHVWFQAGGALIICALGYMLGQRYKLPLNIDMVPFVLIFFYAGFLFKKYDGINKSSVSLGAILMVLWYMALKCDGIELSARYYRSFPACIFSIAGAIAATFCVIYFSNEVVQKIKVLNTFLTFCGKHSLAILCIHFMERYSNFDIVSTYFTNHLGLGTFTQEILFSIIRVTFCVSVCYLYTLILGAYKTFKSKKSALNCPERRA